MFAATTNFSPSFDVQCGSFIVNYNAWIFEIALPDTVNAIIPAASVKEIRVYPNPTKDYIQFGVPATAGRQALTFEVGEMCVFDVYGREVAREDITSEQTILDVSRLPGRVYFYRMALEEVIYSGKFVIQK